MHHFFPWLTCNFCFLHCFFPPDCLHFSSSPLCVMRSFDDWFFLLNHVLHFAFPFLTQYICYTIKQSLILASIDRLIDWTIDWLFVYSLLDSIDWLIDYLISSIDWLIDRVIDWLITWFHWVIDWLIECSVDWLIEAVISDCMIFRCRLKIASWRRLQVREI